MFILKTWREAPYRYWSYSLYAQCVCPPGLETVSAHLILALIQLRKPGFGFGLLWVSGPGCPHCLPSSAYVQSATCMSDYPAAPFSSWGSYTLLILDNLDAKRTWTSSLLG